MRLRLRLRSVLLRVVCSERFLLLRRRATEIARRLTGRQHIVSVFLELDDPYSYLLCHYLPEFAARFDVEMRYYLTEAAGADYRPEPDLYAEYALEDCRRMAAELGVPFLDKGTAPVEHRRSLLNMLVHTAGSAKPQDYAAEVLAAITAYWRGDAEAAARRDTPAMADVDAHLAGNQRLLRKLGHYETAMLHYGGEWFRGIERLHHLMSRLDELDCARGDRMPQRLASIAQVMQLALPVKPPSTARELPPLEFYFSFRSPYSYLAMQRAVDIATAFNLKLELRPVLPMLMRGMQVPRRKLRYIAADTSREARFRGIPFGRFMDPLGEGVERCLAVQQYALGENREQDFVLAAGAGIWSEAIDVAGDKGLRKVTGRAGLFWPDVSVALQDDSWRSIVEENREDMMAAGSWGVPSFRMGDFIVWGQDRDWLLVRHIEDLCESGDGILI